MCFYIQDSRPDPLVAKKDIICYKYGTVGPDLKGEEVFYSRYQNYCYRFGEETKRVLVLRVKRDSVPYITEGYHSYSNKKTVRHRVTLCRQHITKVNQYRQERLGMGSSEDPLATKAVKCIIPKGTRYYYNSEYHEYVSEQIIIQSVL